MLTPEELADACDQLDRLLKLVETEQTDTTPGERAYLAGSRDALAAVLRPDITDAS